MMLGWFKVCKILISSRRRFKLAFASLDKLMTLIA